MKRYRLVIAFAACAAFAAAAGAAGFGGRSGEVHSSGGGRASGGTRVYKQRRVSVARPTPANRGGSPGGNRGGAQGGNRGGAQGGYRGGARTPVGHASIVGNGALVGRISERERFETNPGHYYWHNDGGARYCHYFWGGAHWYGFYSGRSFYWTRFYGNRWWWYDGGYARWTFWWDGYWWWWGPNGYNVYVDNGYYPYDEATGAVTVQSAEVQTAPEKAPAAGSGRVYASPDGRRQVQIDGADAQAFLFDKTGGADPQYMKFLAQGVDKVRYSGGADGKPLTILLEFKDGAFAVYDAQGEPIQSAVASASDSTSKEEEIPGPPPGTPPLPPPAGTNAVPASSTTTVKSAGAKP